MGQPFFEMKSVDISYHGQTVVRDFSIAIQPGEILGIVGESGSGKSSVIRAAMGILGNGGRVTGGSICCQGKNLCEITREEFRKIRGPQMGMIFQNALASLTPIRRIEDQLYEAVQQHENVSRAEIRSRAMEIFAAMNLSDGERILKSYPFELSGGMNQRVGIMMAMIMKPGLLFADEPTSALDVTVQAQVIREMMKMRDTFGTAIAIVTHNIGIVEFMADKVAVMRDGRLVEYGMKHEVIGSPREAYTQKLIRAVPRLNRG